MRNTFDRLLDSWDDLGIWNQYGLTMIAATVVLLGLVEIAPLLA